MANFRPVTALIPGNIGWFADKNDWIARVQTGYPSDTSKPDKLWKELHQEFGFPSFTVGGTVSGSFGSYSYEMLAANPDGTPLLTPIDSPDFLRTYRSPSVIGVYRQYAFGFPNGVPFTRTVTMQSAIATQYNIVGNGSSVIKADDGGLVYGYPIEIGTDQALVQQPDGKIYTVQYQELAAAFQPTVRLSPAQMVAAVQSIGNNPNLSADAKVQQMRVILTDKPLPPPMV